MAEGTVQANGISIWYDTFGDPADPALLLITGTGLQGTFWPVAFCERLAAGGRFVLRFDNRDVGLSQSFSDAEPYTLDDMADDAAGLLDALTIDRAHIVGESMGGMIAQLMAIRYPGRVRTLTSISSTPYTAADPEGAALSVPSLPLAQFFGRPVPETREERIAQSVALGRALAGAAPFDAMAAAERFAEAHDRAWRPEGFVHHALAQRRAGSRVAALKALTAPTLVLHGTADPLIPFDRGEASAALIPGARLTPIEGMGHGIPPLYQDQVVRAILEHTAAR